VLLLVGAEGLGPMHDGWAAISKDPDWLVAKDSSEKAAGGSL